MKKIFTGILLLLFFLYIGATFYVLFMRLGGVDRIADGTAAYNLIPFRTILSYLRMLTYRSGPALLNLVGNLILFMPLGLFLPFFIHKARSAWIYIPSVAIFIIAIELMQFVTMTGSLDIDDFILNFLGAVIGFVLCKYTPIRRVYDLCAYKPLISPTN